MTQFIKDFIEYAEKIGYNLYRVAEIKDSGEVDETTVRNCSLCQNIYSVAKAYTVTAVGMCYDRGLLTPDDEVAKLLGDECPKMHEGFEGLTVGMALLHQIGLPGSFLDIDCFDSNTFGDDFLAYTFSQTPQYKPGTNAIYTDAAFYVLARVCEHLLGEPLDDYFWKTLFGPLGYREAAWSHCPKGHVMGATGLYVTCGDMAKLGKVYNEGGVYNGKRIISEEWVKIVLERGYELKYSGHGEIYGKGGMWGQMLEVDPKHNRVLAWQAFDDKDPAILTEFAANYNG